MKQNKTKRQVRPYGALVEDVRALAAAGVPIAMDPARTSYAVYQAAAEAAAGTGGANGGANGSGKAAAAASPAAGARGSRKRNAAGQAKGASAASAAAAPFAPGAPPSPAVVALESPVVHAKALKNAAELEGMAEAHLRDAAALAEFLAWLEAEVAAGRPLDEVGVDERLTALRRAQVGAAAFVWAGLIQGGWGGVGPPAPQL